ncbi:GbsR/MarR family transcriptional regulator [Streptomyces hoynatensis]|uniref:MarR family transcriptional regulator n=1 Tax=Streptomyces hoynatensis TaxID=1141874 RepID=A0A3A9YUV7_9ACTN|nr:MarR family transcriptional regulator [Streptomyces hoynatensis]
MAAFVERFAADLTEAGMQRMPARVFSCLLASQENGLTSAELATRLQISPAAVSGAVRYLSRLSMLRREREPGSRRERYRLLHNAWYETMLSREPLLSRWSASLRAGIDAVGAGTPAAARLSETAEFMEFLQTELDGILARWRERVSGEPAVNGATAATGESGVGRESGAAAGPRAVAG